MVVDDHNFCARVYGHLTDRGSCKHLAFRCDFDRDFDIKSRSFAFGAFDADNAAHHFNQLFRDGKAKPRAAIFARCGDIGLYEFFKYNLALVFGNADTRIFDTEEKHRIAGLVARARDIYLHIADIGELDRIADQVAHNLLQPCRIAHKTFRYDRIYGTLKNNAFARSDRPQQINRLANGAARVEGNVFKRQFSGFNF